MASDNKIVTQLKRIYGMIGSNIKDKQLQEYFFKNTFIAGGAIRSLMDDIKINDYDFWFTSNTALSYFHKLIVDENINTEDIFSDKIVLIASSDNAYTFKYNDNIVFQFITIQAGLPAKVVSQFDFTNCMGWYRYSNNDLYISPEMKDAIRGRTLVYNKLTANNPASGFERALAFQKRGYTLTPEVLWSIFEANSELKPELVKKLKEEYKVKYGIKKQKGVKFVRKSNISSKSAYEILFPSTNTAIMPELTPVEVLQRGILMTRDGSPAKATINPLRIKPR